METTAVEANLGADLERRIRLIEDRFAIRELTARYNRAVDEGREPDAGSDLFALRTRATRDGDEWVLNGQKTWQTAGSEPNWIFVLARTGAGEQRSKGLSLILVPLEQDGNCTSTCGAHSSRGSSWVRRSGTGSGWPPFCWMPPCWTNECCFSYAGALVTAAGGGGYAHERG